MSKTLVIVESPAKARTIHQYLDKDTAVKASMGHVQDLPAKTMGVDIQNDFQPHYVTTSSGKKVISQLKPDVSDAEAIYLATDPDREGEAIAWHLQQLLESETSGTFNRVDFHEITRSAVQEAFQSPGSVDMNRVNAQQARRVIDRLVGYKVSPLLWKNIKRGTSAGRVQSVALRLVCELEEKIQNFVPEEYWVLTATFQPQENQPSFTAKLAKLDGKKAHVPDAETANKLASELTDQPFEIANVSRKNRKKNPPPPFITSTLQQAASGKLRLSTGQTMRIAQQLYEGLDVGEGVSAGLITYMRTDSVSISKEAQQQARGFISEIFGDNYVPEKPNVYKSKQSAQGAHEAIRPTDARRRPEDIEKHLGKQQAQVYRLIYNRFVASQMAPAQLRQHSLDVAPAESAETAHSYLFRTTVTETTFYGYQKMYSEEDSNKLNGEDAPAKIPDLKKGAKCSLENLDKQQKFTEPPRRYSEATLVRELENNGVGRPSTYSSIVNTIQERDYVRKEKGLFVPTDLGKEVNSFLVSNMSEVFQVNFTAEMEDKLDQIEAGEGDWTTMVRDFYEAFQKSIPDAASVALPKDSETIKRFINLFPEDLEWDAPQKRGGRTYDDKKFRDSLKKQIEEKGKNLSEKQWQALLRLVAKYWDRLSGAQDLTDELGITDQMQTLIQEQTQRTEEAQEGPSEESKLLIEGLTNVTEWKEASNSGKKKGKKKRDDKTFFDSLREQVENGSALSAAQQKVLRNLALKYREQVPNFESLAEKAQLNTSEQASEVSEEQAKPLLEMLEHIQEWAEPRKVGRRTYDDKQFAASLKEQFDQKRGLSEKQFEALKKILTKYYQQIPDYDAQAEKYGLSPSKELDREGQTVGECPKCGGALLSRRGKKGEFFGCENYPKCKHTASTAEEKEQVTKNQ